jgi:hypothetical protein
LKLDNGALRWASLAGDDCVPRPSDNNILYGLQGDISGLIQDGVEGYSSFAIRGSGSGDLAYFNVTESFQLTHNSFEMYLRYNANENFQSFETNPFLSLIFCDAEDLAGRRVEVPIIGYATGSGVWIKVVAKLEQIDDFDVQSIGFRYAEIDSSHFRELDLTRINGFNNVPSPETDSWVIIDIDGMKLYNDGLDSINEKYYLDDDAPYPLCFGSPLKVPAVIINQSQPLVLAEDFVLYNSTFECPTCPIPFSPSSDENTNLIFEDIPADWLIQPDITIDGIDYYYLTATVQYNYGPRKVVIRGYFLDDTTFRCEIEPNAPTTIQTYRLQNRNPYHFPDSNNIGSGNKNFKLDWRRVGEYDNPETAWLQEEYSGYNLVGTVGVLHYSTLASTNGRVYSYSPAWIYIHSQDGNKINFKYLTMFPGDAFGSTQVDYFEIANFEFASDINHVTVQDLNLPSTPINNSQIFNPSAEEIAKAELIGRTVNIYNENGEAVTVPWGSKEHIDIVNKDIQRTTTTEHRAERASYNGYIDSISTFVPIPPNYSYSPANKITLPAGTEFTRYNLKQVDRYVANIIASAEVAGVYAIKEFESITSDDEQLVGNLTNTQIPPDVAIEIIPTTQDPTTATQIAQVESQLNSIARQQELLERSFNQFYERLGQGSFSSITTGVNMGRGGTIAEQNASGQTQPSVTSGVTDTGSSASRPTGRNALEESSAAAPTPVRQPPKRIKTFLSGAKLTKIPEEYYTVTLDGEINSRNSGTLIEFSPPLSTRKGWDAQIYVDVVSSQSNNPVENIRFIIGTYMQDFAADSASFEEAALLVAEDELYSNFALFGRNEPESVIEQIAFLCKCALFYEGNTIKIKYLDVPSEFFDRRESE